MLERRLTISGSHGQEPDGRPCSTQIPTLHLAGLWLDAAGFPIGARVEVKLVEPGRLVMTRLDLGGPLPNLLPLVWVPVERLAAIEEAGAAAVSRG